jgi:Fe-S-cluster containining protein
MRKNIKKKSNVLKSRFAIEELLIQTNKTFATKVDKDFEEEINIANENGYTVACKQGCSACCYQIVTINITDAVRIAKRMISMSDVEIEKIRLAAETATKANRRIRYDSMRWAMQIPCSFLSDSNCSIYEDRPIVCRTTNTVEAEGYCEQLLKEKNPRGHDVRGVVPEGYDNATIDLSLLSPLINNGVISGDNKKHILLCTQIDLDQLALFMAKPQKSLRELNFAKLIALDKKILGSLKKRSINLGDEDQQVFSRK